MVRFLRGLVVVLAAAALTLCVGLGVAWAQAAPIPFPISAGTPVAVPAGLSVPVTFDARGVGGAANAGYYTRPVLVSNNTLAGLGRGLLRRSVPVAAMLAAIEAAGWAIDELTGQVIPANSPSPTIQPGQQYCYSERIPDAKAPTCSGELLDAACKAGTAAVWWATKCPGSVGGIRQITATHTVYEHVYADGQIADNLIIVHAASQPFPNSYYVPPTPMTDAQMADLVKNNPEVAREALRNPDGSINRNPDVMAAAEALAAEIAAAAENPQQDWDQGNQSGPDPTPPAADAGEFCAFASIVCEWIGWTQEPVFTDDDEGHFDIPRVEVAEELPSWSSGLGAGSCPAPRTVETFVGAITVPFDIFCSLALTLRGLFLAAAYITAAYILLGVHRG